MDIPRVSSTLLLDIPSLQTQIYFNIDPCLNQWLLTTSQQEILLKLQHGTHKFKNFMRYPYWIQCMLLYSISFLKMLLAIH